MHSPNNAVSRINTVVAARQSSEITTSQTSVNITNVIMSRDTPGSTHSATSFHSTAATYQPAASTVQSHALAAAGATRISQAHSSAYPAASSAQREAIRTHTHALTLPYHVQQLFETVTSVDEQSKPVSITANNLSQIAGRFMPSPEASTRPPKRQRRGAITIPPLTAEQTAENEMTEILGIINRREHSRENPHFLRVQNNLLQGSMEKIGPHVIGQALSDATVEALANRLVTLKPDRCLEEMRKSVRVSPLNASIAAITRNTVMPYPPPPAVPDPVASTSTATTPQNKRKVNDKPWTTPQAAKRSQQVAIPDDDLNERPGEAPETWVIRLRKLGISDDRIHNITKYSIDFIRYSGCFVEHSKKLAQAQAIKKELCRETEKLRRETGEKTGNKEFAQKLDQLTRHLELTDKQKCALHVHKEQTLRFWQIIRKPRKRAIMARNMTDLTGCKTELEKAERIKATNPKLNMLDLLDLTDVTEEELRTNPLFLDLTEVGRHAFANVKRREFTPAQPGREAQPREDDEDFGIRLLSIYNQDPAKPGLTYKDLGILTGMSRSAVRSRCKLQKPTKETKELSKRYPQNGREKLEWAVYVHTQDSSVTLDQLSVLVQLDRWVIAAHEHFLEWTPEAREAEVKFPRGGRSNRQYALYLYDQCPHLTAKDIYRLSDYRVATMRKDKVNRGEFDRLFGDRFSPMYYPRVHKRAAARRAKEAGLTATTAVVSATRDATASTSTAVAPATSSHQPTTVITAVPPTPSPLQPIFESTDFDHTFADFTPPEAMLRPSAPSPLPALLPLSPDAIHMTSPAPSPDDDDMEDWIDKMPDLPSCLSSVFDGQQEMDIPEDMPTSLPVLNFSLSPILYEGHAMDIPEDAPASLPVLNFSLSPILTGSETMAVADLQQLTTPGATAWLPSTREAWLLADMLLRNVKTVNNHPVNWILDMLVAAPEWPPGFVLDVTDQRNGGHINWQFRNPDHPATTNEKVISLISTRDVMVNNVASAYWELDRRDQDGQERLIPENNDSLFEAIRHGLEVHGCFGFSVEHQRNALADEWISHPEKWLENADRARLRRVLETAKINMSLQQYNEFGPESPDQ